MHVLGKPNFDKYFIIYTNATKESIFVILLQKDYQNNNHPIDYMIQSLSDDEFKYTLIEKHTYVLVKDIEKFCHFILGKHTHVKVPLSTINFFFLKHVFQEILHIGLIRYKNIILQSQHRTQSRDKIYLYTWLNILNQVFLLKMMRVVCLHFFLLNMKILI
jgi:hypothetical protein